MDLRLFKDKQQLYNSLITHIIQSWQWGEVRRSLKVPLVRYGIFKKNKLISSFQITLHQIPFTKYCVGYLPKGPFPDKELAETLEIIGKKLNCAFIKIEPDVQVKNAKHLKIDPRFKISPKPLFTKYNFVVDLTKSEEELLKNMHPKTRYNIKVAEKYKVKIEQRSDEKALQIYLKLYFLTTQRQGYLGHNQNYHKNVWQKLSKAKMARFLIATYNNIPLTAWMLVTFKDTLYYPYGGSSAQYRNVMANNLVAWEAIRLGRKLGLKKFDMWGALGPDANPEDPWFGFHKFKQGYGGELQEYLGTYDLVFNYPVYILFTFIDKLTPLKVFLLKLLKR